MSTVVTSPQAGPRFGEIIRRWGVTAWQLVGVLLAAGLSYVLLVAFSGLIVPLVLAVVVGTLGVGLVDRLQGRGIPRPIGALIVILMALGALLASISIIVTGVVGEAAEIRVVVSEALVAVEGWMGEGDGDPVLAGERFDRAVETGRPLLTGAASWATSVFSSALAFALGFILALFILYYVLVDWRAVRNWLAAHIGIPPDLGAAIIDDATGVVRSGFAALTITSLVTSGIVGTTVLVLGLPLALAVTFVTFVGSYIPYVGAFVSGAFAFLIALGASGPREALILLVVIVVVQTAVQTVVGSRMTSHRLRLHPLPSLIVSVFGVAVAGLLGAILSAPALALGFAVSRRTRRWRATGELPKGIEP